MPEKLWKVQHADFSDAYQDSEPCKEDLAILHRYGGEVTVTLLTVRTEAEETDLQEKLAAGRQLLEITRPYLDCLRAVAESKESV